MIKAGPDLAGIDGFSAAVIAQQQCSETYPAPMRLSVAGDDEFLLFTAFEFQPVARSPGDVNAVAVLCDHPLPSFATRLAIVVLSLRLPMFGELQRTFEFKCIPKELFSVSKRGPSRVVAIEVEQIEEIEPYRDPAKQIGGRMRDLHAFLKFRKAGDPILERDDLAIDDEESGLLLMQCPRDVPI